MSCCFTAGRIVLGIWLSAFPVSALIAIVSSCKKKTAISCNILIGKVNLFNASVACLGYFALYVTHISLWNAGCRRFFLTRLNVDRLYMNIRTIFDCIVH